MQHLIFKKLEASDQYFLDNADNNMIYRLFYVEFEDYVKHIHNFVSCFPLIIFYFFTLLYSLYWPSPILMIVLGAHFMKVVFVLSLEILKRRQYIIIKEQAFE